MALEAPVDYYGALANIPDPGQKFEEGIAWAKQQKELEKAKARQAKMEADYAALTAGPMTAVKLRDFTLKYPEVGDKFKGAIDSLSADEKKAAVQQFLPAATALYSGDAKIAEQQLRTISDAYKNAGNAQMAKLYGDAAESIKISPEQANVVLSMMAHYIDPEWAGKVDASRKTGAETLKIGAETRGMTADAIVKEAEAKFAPEKVAAELGLTQAQIEQAKAAAAASRAAARNSDAQAAGANSGFIPPDKRASVEADMRKEYTTVTKSYQDVKDAYGRVLAATPTPAGDMALIFNYMKMLDPGTGVKEGEYATAANAASIPTRIVMLYNRAVAGRGLEDEKQRKDFINQAKLLYSQATGKEKVVRDGLTRMAVGYGLNPSNIFYEAVETPPTAPAGAAPPPAAVAPPPSAATAGGVGSQVRVSVKY